MNLIFDFDGTIVDSFEYVLGFLALEAGQVKPAGALANKYRGRSMKEMALSFHIPAWRLPMLFFKGRRVMRDHMNNLSAFDGMGEVIEQLYHDGNRLFIVSSNSARNIRRFLIEKNLSQYFYAVRGGAGLYGKDNIIRSLQKRFKLEGETWYIGDELSDIRAAKAAKIKIAVVTWGFASKNELAARSPDFMAFKPNDLLKLRDNTCGCIGFTCLLILN